MLPARETEEGFAAAAAGERHRALVLAAGVWAAVAAAVQETGPGAWGWAPDTVQFWFVVIAVVVAATRQAPETGLQVHQVGGRPRRPFGRTDWLAVSE